MAGYNDQYGLNVGQMNQIIQATSESQAQMTKVIQNMDMVASGITAGMRSDAGRLLDARVQRWNGEFASVISKLQALNTKVAGVRDAQIASDQTATGQAGSGR